MTSAVRKRSVVIDGHKTSVTLEDPFWQALREMAGELRSTLSSLIKSIRATQTDNGNLSSAIRLHVLAHIQARVATSPEVPETSTRDMGMRFGRQRVGSRVP
jgi:predicted DNA-binding ribbon-helix-helix protein